MLQILIIKLSFSVEHSALVYFTLSLSLRFLARSRISDAIDVDEARLVMEFLSKSSFSFNESRGSLRDSML